MSGNITISFQDVANAIRDGARAATEAEMEAEKHRSEAVKRKRDLDNYVVETDAKMRKMEDDYSGHIQDMQNEVNCLHYSLSFLDGKCPVCKDAFDDTRQPYLLGQCGHVHCLDCIREMASNRPLSCSVCRSTDLFDEGTVKPAMTRWVVDYHSSKPHVQLRSLYASRTEVVDIDS